MNKRLLLVGLSVAIFLPFHTYAGPIMRTGESISIDATQTLKGDFYGAGSRINISGSSENDVYVGGGTVTINAPVAEDLTVLGGVVQIHGDIGDDLRVVAGEVTIAKTVKGDVVVVGGSLNILSTASIEGDVLFLGKELVIDGPVIGSLHGTADTVRINAEVGGDISATVESLFTLGSNARIKNGITYTSTNDIVRAQDAVIDGEVQKIPLSRTKGNSSWVRTLAFEALVLAFMTLALFVLVRKQIRTVVTTTVERIGFSGLIGIMLFTLIPFVAVMLLVSVLGVLAGVLLLFSYVSLVFVSIALAPIILGYALQKVLLKNTSLTLQTVGIGIVAFVLLGLIPYVGGLLVFGCFIMTFGGLGMALFRGIRGE